MTRLRRNPPARAVHEVEAYLRTQGVLLDAHKIAGLADAVAQDFAGAGDPHETMKRKFATWEADARMYGPPGLGNAIHFAGMDAHKVTGSPISKAIAGRLVSVYVPVSQASSYFDLIEKITWILDDRPVARLDAQRNETWRGRLSEFWAQLDDPAATFSPEVVDDILGLEPGDGIDLQSGRSHFTLLRLGDWNDLQAPVAAAPPEDLALINRVRRQLGMGALDPAAVGWSDDDVRLEAQRLRREGNPRAACLSWSGP